MTLFNLRYLAKIRYKVNDFIWFPFKSFHKKGLLFHNCFHSQPCKWDVQPFDPKTLNIFVLFQMSSFHHTWYIIQPKSKNIMFEIIAYYRVFSRLLWTSEHGLRPIIFLSRKLGLFLAQSRFELGPVSVGRQLYDVFDVSIRLGLKK